MVMGGRLGQQQGGSGLVVVLGSDGQEQGPIGRLVFTSNNGQEQGPIGEVITDVAITGEIILFGSTANPTGYLACDGAAVSRTTFAALFALIGTTFGAGNGSTTFNVPNLNARTPIGTGGGSGLTTRTIGQTGGAETVALATGEMRSMSPMMALKANKNRSHNCDLFLFG